MLESELDDQGIGHGPQVFDQDAECLALQFIPNHRSAHGVSKLKDIGTPLFQVIVQEGKKAEKKS